MPVPEEVRKSNRKRPQFGVFIMLLVIGLINFSGVTQSPQFESYRTLDVIRLVLSGACFGVAFFGLMVKILRPHT
jgi:hypothetical protein